MNAAELRALQTLPLEDGPETKTYNIESIEYGIAAGTGIPSLRGMACIQIKFTENLLNVAKICTGTVNKALYDAQTEISGTLTAKFPWVVFGSLDGDLAAKSVDLEILTAVKGAFQRKCVLLTNGHVFNEKTMPWFERIVIHPNNICGWWTRWQEMGLTHAFMKQKVEFNVVLDSSTSETELIMRSVEKVPCAARYLAPLKFDDGGSNRESVVKRVLQNPAWRLNDSILDF